MRCRSCAFWPIARVRRSSNSLRSPATALATVGSFSARQQVGREVDGLGAVALGLEPRLARRQLVETLGDDGQIGARHGVVEPHDDLARLDAVAVAHAQLADDAAGRVLHLLHVGIDDDGALRDHRAGQFGRRRPAADTAGKNDDDDDPRQPCAGGSIGGKCRVR